MQYDLPTGWEKNSFFKTSWESPGGSDVCPCAVAVNSLKIPAKDVPDYIYVVIYPSDKKYVNTEKRQNLWRYQFIPAAKSDVVKTEYMNWSRQISKLKPLGTYENKFKDYSVYRLYSDAESTHYVMYVLGKATHLQKYKAEINTIINSFKSIK